METQQLLEVKRTSEAKWRPKIWSLLATWVFGLAFLTMALVPSHCNLRSDLRRAAWAGGRRGPVERRLGATSVADAIAILTKAAQLAKEIQAEVLRIKAAVEDAEYSVKLLSESKRKQQEARCVLQTMSAAESVVKVVTNLKASAAVCGEDPLFEILDGEFGHLVRSLKRWVCVINIELVLVGLFSIASDLAMAAVSCSVAANSSSSLSVDQRVDATCTSAGLSMVDSLVTLSAALQITIPGCEILKQGIQDQLKAGLSSLQMGSPASFGTPDLTRMSSSEREELKQKIETELTPDNFADLSGIFNPGRRLFLGGGPETLMTMCVVDLLQALTQLALMGVTLSGIEADCQVPSFGELATAVPKPLQDRVTNTVKGTCATYVGKVLANLGIATLYLSFTSFHCTNKANIRAICGAGIAGVEAALAGLAASGAGAYVACTEGKRRKGTAFLIEKSLISYVKEEAEEKIHEVCPNFSLECLIELRSFFQDCESGLNSSCPRALAVESCPGIESCAAEFEAYRSSASGSPWFSTLSLKEFAKFVQMAQSCFSYLSCFSTSRRLQEDSEHLQSSAMRSLVLQHALRPSALRIHTKPISERDTEQMRLPDELWASIGRHVPASRNLSVGDFWFNASGSGGQILQEVSEQWKREKTSKAMCYESRLIDS